VTSRWRRVASRIGRRTVSTRKRSHGGEFASLGVNECRRGVRTCGTSRKPQSPSLITNKLLKLLFDNAASEPSPPNSNPDGA